MTISIYCYIHNYILFKIWLWYNAKNIKINQLNYLIYFNAYYHKFGNFKYNFFMTNVI